MYRIVNMIAAIQKRYVYFYSYFHYNHSDIWMPFNVTKYYYMIKLNMTGSE